MCYIMLGCANKAIINQHSSKHRNHHFYRLWLPPRSHLAPCMFTLQAGKLKPAVSIAHSTTIITTTTSTHTLTLFLFPPALQLCHLDLHIARLTAC